MKYILCVLYLIFSISGLTFMKLGGMKEYLTIVKIQEMKITWVSFLGYSCYAISFLLYTFIINKFELKFVIPVLGGIVNILIIAIGVLVFHEKMTIQTAVGIVFVLAGIFIMNIHSS